MNVGADRWQRVSELFDRVVDLAWAERDRILAQECAADPRLRTEVERLLQADGRTNPLDRDIVGHASQLLLEGDPHEHEGQLFGPYRIVRLLGQGGMGRVYLAQREGEDFTQTVALKLVGGYGSFDAQAARRRFLDERRILARLQHPHIARLLDGGVGPESQPWFAMEYVDGAALTEWCDARRLSLNERLLLFAKVCDAVDHAHRFLIVHRDLKPGNVLVDGQGEPKVLDFGIAKLLDEGEQAKAGSTVLMTPDYAAPEQIRGGVISTATDVYALGAVLFELLTGMRPFPDPLAPRQPPHASRAVTDGKDIQARALQRGATSKSLRKRLKGDADRVLRTALDPEPSRRYRSAATLAQDLRAIAQGKAISLRSDRGYRLGVFLRRHKWETAVATAAVLGLIGTTGWALRQQSVATAHALVAREQTAVAQEEALASERVTELLLSAFDEANPERRKETQEPTAQDVLNAGARLADKELAQTPKVRGRIYAAIGSAYVSLGQYDKAATFTEKAIADHSSQEVNDITRAALATAQLTEIELSRGRPERAIALAPRAVALFKSIAAPPKEMKFAYEILGMAQIRSNHFKAAAESLREAERYVLMSDGSPSTALAWSIHNRGALGNRAGNVREAEKLFREAHAMHVKARSGKQAEYSTKNLLAVALTRQGRFGEARALLQANRAVAGQLYGGKGSHYGLLQHRMADIEKHQGDLALAQRGYEETLKTELAASKAGMNAANIMQDLAFVMENRGDPAGAGELYGRALALVNEDKTSDFEQLRAKARYAAFRTRTGSGERSGRPIELLTQWVGRYEPIDRTCPWDLAEAKFLLAEQYYLLSRWEDALSALPPDDPIEEQPTVQARRHFWLAKIHSAAGRHEQGAVEYEKALSLLQATAGSGSAWLALWRLEYAEALVARGAVEEAGRVANLAYPVLVEQLLPEAAQFARLSTLRTTAAAYKKGS